MKHIHLIPLALLITHSAAFAAPAADAGPGGQGASAPRFSLGAGIGISSSIYAGQDRKLLPVPMVNYDSERFFWRGLGGGIHLVEQDGYSFDATISARLGGIEKKDFGARELAARGINRDLLDDRDFGLDVGLALGWKGEMGKLELGIKADASGASKGYEGNLKYGYPIQWQATRITPHLGVAILSDKLANYYYGTLASEVARGVVNYKPGRVAVPAIGLDVMHPLNGQWIMLGSMSYKKLPSKITDSPLLKKDTKGSALLYIGAARAF